MDGLVMTGQLLLALSIMVILHELGHFVAARIFGMRIEKFFLFFDIGKIKFLSVKKGDTEYGIGILPLGGYVKISGMIDESLDTEALKKPPEPWEFRSKPAWQRLIVMVGGVTVNLLLGMAIFSYFIFVFGERHIPMSQLKHGVVALEFGKETGLQTGDKILKVNGRVPERFSDVMDPSIFLENNSVITIERNGMVMDVSIPPGLLRKISKSKDYNFIDKRMTFFVEGVVKGSNAAKAGLQPEDRIINAAGKPVRFFDEFKNILSENRNKEIPLLVVRRGGYLSLKTMVDTTGKIGIATGTNDFREEVTRYGFFESIGRGSYKAFDILVLNIRGLGKVLRGEIPASESIQGPVAIAAIYGGTWDWLKFWSITGVLSMILAFMNILPIPALDGGHVLFLSVEAVTGIKFSDKFMENTQKVGLAILISLMILIIGNDVWKIFN